MSKCVVMMSEWDKQAANIEKKKEKIKRWINKGTMMILWSRW